MEVLTLIVIGFVACCCCCGITVIICEYSKKRRNIQRMMNADTQYQIQNLQYENQRLNNTIANLYKNEKILNETSKLNEDLANLKKELEMLEKQIIFESSVVDFEDGITSEEEKNSLSVLILKQNDFIKSDKAVILSNNELSKKATNNNIKQLLRCFNSETASLMSTINAINIDIVRGKIVKSFDLLNKLFETDNIKLSHELLKMKLDQAILINKYEQKRENEKEQQREIRAQMVEEDKVRREIEKEKVKIEKEESQFKNEISKLMAYLQKASDIEKQLYVDKINELEEKLKLLEIDKENVLQREQNTRAGFVYIISNIGSFGENIYKIGMTRRLEPLDRVKELGDASVPFEFDIHAMIFSEDAPALETILHETFRSKEVNKINHRKEFFKVDLEEIEKTVLENHNSTVIFTKLAKAEQYRETLKLSS